MQSNPPLRLEEILFKSQRKNRCNDSKIIPVTSWAFKDREQGACQSHHENTPSDTL